MQSEAGCARKEKRPLSHLVLSHKRSPFSGGNRNGEVGEEQPEEPDKTKATETVTVVDKAEGVGDRGR